MEQYEEWRKRNKRFFVAVKIKIRYFSRMTGVVTAPIPEGTGF